jgi:AraC-like DNA-binding protein
MYDFVDAGPIADRIYGPGDELVAQLIGRLFPPQEAELLIAKVYTDGFHATLLAHLTRLRHRAAPVGRQSTPLPIWRLKRLHEFVDAHIDQKITLGVMAQTAGLSPMHFAAQFKAATGLRPHAYLLRRRISLAKEMLRDRSRSIVDVALSVGFPNQAHFTTVFKHNVGLTPHRWRVCQSEGRLNA